jgi:hypothetical protein
VGDSLDPEEVAVKRVIACCVLLGAISANPVQFWGGKNPFAAGDPRTRVVFGPSGEMLRATRDAAGGIALDSTDPQGATHRVVLAERADGIVALDGAGRELSRVDDASFAGRAS